MRAAWTLETISASDFEAFYWSGADPTNPALTSKSILIVGAIPVKHLYETGLRSSERLMRRMDGSLDPPEGRGRGDHGLPIHLDEYPHLFSYSLWPSCHETRRQIRSFSLPTLISNMGQGGSMTFSPNGTNCTGRATSRWTLVLIGVRNLPHNFCPAPLLQP